MNEICEINYVNRDNNQGLGLSLFSELCVDQTFLAVSQKGNAGYVKVKIFNPCLVLIEVLLVPGFRLLKYRHAIWACMPRSHISSLYICFFMTKVCQRPCVLWCVSKRACNWWKYVPKLLPRQSDRASSYSIRRLDLQQVGKKNPAPPIALLSSGLI